MAIYHTENLTALIVTMTSKAQMFAFLSDRERSCRSKLKKGLAQGLPSEELLPQINELNLILSLRKEINHEV